MERQVVRSLLLALGLALFGCSSSTGPSIEPGLQGIVGAWEQVSFRGAALPAVMSEYTRHPSSPSPVECVLELVDGRLEVEPDGSYRWSVQPLGRCEDGSDDPREPTVEAGTVHPAEGGFHLTYSSPSGTPSTRVAQVVDGTVRFLDGLPPDPLIPAIARFERQD